MATKDEAQALAEVAARLRERLPHISGDTIQEVVDAAYREFDGAPIRDFVVILVERMAFEKVERRVA